MDKLKNNSLKSIYNQVGFGYLVFLLVYTLVPLLIPNKLLLGFANPAVGNMVVNYLIMYLIGLPLLVLILKQVKTPPDLKVPLIKFTPWKMTKIYAFCWSITIVLALFSNIINNFIGKFVTGYSADALAEGMLDKPTAIMFLFAVIIAPVMEELTFRWIPYKLISGHQPQVYVLYTSIAFGLTHLNLGQFFYATALGLIFSVIVLKTGKFYYTMILHLLINFTGGGGLARILLEGSLPAKIAISLFYLILTVGGFLLCFITLLKYAPNLKKQLRSFLKEIRVHSEAFFNTGTLIYYIVSIGFILFLIFNL